MSKNIEDTLKLALEALEMVKANADDWQERTGKEIKGWMQPVNNSITTIKEALTQTEQEPVAWLSEGGNFSFVPYQCSTPLYTSPPPQHSAIARTWVGLTDEEINTAASVQSWKPFAKAIEAKLKEKNTNA